jgi:biopolymer transport protein ExbB/TolQ
MNESLLIDVLVIVLLGATIYFAFRLDRRLHSLRNIQAEMASVVQELNMAASRAEAGIQGLRLAAESSGRSLEDKIRDAAGIGEELAILMKSSERAGRQVQSERSQSFSPARPKSSPALDALRAIGVPG